MKRLISFLILCAAVLTAGAQTPARTEADFPEVPGRWSVERINAWYDRLPWLVGCNYYPATAINQIEMWQASTWDPATIDKELGWAEGIGFNTLRVYLHDLVWADDEQGLYKRMDQFLDICSRHGIRPFFVFFDDCHFPKPQLGEQPLPVRNYHNSGWVNSPARDVAIRYAEGKATPEEAARLKGYVQRTMTRFKDDGRVLCWELYNEPGRGAGENGNMGNAEGSKQSIGDLSNRLLYDAWKWAREVNPSQPVMSTSHGAVGKLNTYISRTNSDMQSVHSYEKPEVIERIVKNYGADGRPVFMTEWLARPRGSRVANCLPLMKKLRVAAINWGLVAGKSGTNWPWSSRRIPGPTLAERRASGDVVRPGEPFPEPEVWFHDIFRTDGTPFDAGEIEIFRKLTGKTK